MAENPGYFYEYNSAAEKELETSGSPWHKSENSNFLLAFIQLDPIWQLPQPVSATSSEKGRTRRTYVELSNFKNKNMLNLSKQVQKTFSCNMQSKYRYDD